MPQYQPTIHRNHTYEKIKEISAYLTNLRKEFSGQTVGDMISLSDRITLEEKYADLLLLVVQLNNTTNYILSEEYNGDSY